MHGGNIIDELAQFKTPAQRKAFEAVHPRRQMITKTDLAKFENTWSQLPHLVSRGAQKCYLSFMDILDRRGNFLPDEAFFKRAVARAILFKEIERIVSRQKFGGYRANIVTYTLAMAVTLDCPSESTLKQFGTCKVCHLHFSSFIETLCHRAHRHITNAPGGQNITEWCKKETCWEKFRDHKTAIPAAVEEELLSRDKVQTSGNSHALEEQMTDEEAELISRISEISADTWFALSAWAKDTQSLQPWQRSLSYSLGKLAQNGKRPSRKQALHGDGLITEARTLGFRD